MCDAGGKLWSDINVGVWSSNGTIQSAPKCHWWLALLLLLLLLLLDAIAFQLLLSFAVDEQSRKEKVLHQLLFA